jgi:hypothetical protein
MKFFWGREEEDKRRPKNGQTWFFFLLFLETHILKKISSLTFWCMFIPLSPHSVYTHWGVQRLKKLIFFKRLDHGKRPSSRAGSLGLVVFWVLLQTNFQFVPEIEEGKRPSSMIQLHGAWCKAALRWVLLFVVVNFKYIRFARRRQTSWQQ